MHVWKKYFNQKKKFLGALSDYPIAICICILYTLRVCVITSLLLFYITFSSSVILYVVFKLSV